MNSIDFLDAVRDRHGLDSDNKLAAFLDINRGRVSLYRTGTRTLDPVACGKIAAALDVDPGYVMASIQAERAKRKDEREVWLRLAQLAKKGQRAAALGAVVLGGLFTSTDGAVASPVDQASAPTMYIM